MPDKLELFASMPMLTLEAYVLEVVFSVLDTRSLLVVAMPKVTSLAVLAVWFAERLIVLPEMLSTLVPDGMPLPLAVMPTATRLALATVIDWLSGTLVMYVVKE